jgi:hypothetical protein
MQRVARDTIEVLKDMNLFSDSSQVKRKEDDLSYHA